MPGNWFGLPRTVPDRQIVTDQQGALKRIFARIGCVEAVLAKPGRAPDQVLMPARRVVNDRLAEIDGAYGGPLSLAYDETWRDLVEVGFRVDEDRSLEFLSCTEYGRADCPLWGTPACPWHVEGEKYAPGECPMDRWRLYRS